jgi:hypothetical protein
MATKTDIINLALSKLGSERLTLTDSEITDNTLSHAKTVNLHYTNTLDELVRMHKWNCCKARKRLGSYKIQIVNGSSFGSTTVILEATGTSASGRPIFDSVAPNTAITSTTDGYTKLEFDEDNGGRWKLTRRQSITRTHFVTSTAYTPTLTFESDGDIATVTVLKPDFEYSYQHRLPSDFIRTSYVTNTSEVYYYGELAFYKLLLEEFNNVIMPEARRANAFEKQDAPEVDSEYLESTYTTGSSISNSRPPFSQTSYGSFS